MSVDAIIPAFSEPPESIRRTIEGLLRQDNASVRRIVVVDDASPKPVVLQGDPPIVELLRLRTNVGIAAARNAAAVPSTADYLLFVNCDVVLTSTWLRSAVGFIEAHPAVAAVGGRVVPQVGSPLLRRWRMRFLENPEQRDAFGERSVTWLVGHATLIRRTMFQEVGGFDPVRRLAGEDYDLCARLRARGCELYHLPQLVADSYEVPSIDLFARKVLRNNGWNLSPPTGVPGSARVDVRTVRRLPASLSVLRSLVMNSGRNLYKLRLSFLPVDVAIAARGLALVWMSNPRGRRAS